jgi:glycerophosphoryl diester phosphodiesterase
VDIESKSASDDCQTSLSLSEDKLLCENTFANVFSPLRRKNKEEHGVVICGHRGAGVYEPENTMRAFQKALQLKLVSIEFDVSTFMSS